MTAAVLERPVQRPTRGPSRSTPNGRPSLAEYFSLSDRVSAVQGVVSMMIVIYGGEIPEEQLPAETVICDLFSGMLENLIWLKEASKPYGAGMVQAASSALAVVEAICSVWKWNEFEDPFSGKVADQLLAAIKVAVDDYVSDLESVRLA